MRVLNRYRHEIPNGSISITRPGPHGNPVIFGATCPKCGHVHKREDDAAGLACFAELLASRIQRDEGYREALQSAEFATALVCVCAPALCHGDGLAAYLIGYGTGLGMAGLGPDEEPSKGQRGDAHARGMSALESWLQSLISGQTNQRDFFR